MFQFLLLFKISKITLLSRTMTKASRGALHKKLMQSRKCCPCRESCGGGTFCCYSSGMTWRTRAPCEDTVQLNHDRAKSILKGMRGRNGSTMGNRLLYKTAQRLLRGFPTCTRFQRFILYQHETVL